MPGPRIGQSAGELSGLRVRQVRGGLAEVAAAGRLGPEHARTEFRGVEVELQDAAFVELPLELPGERDLLELPVGVARRREPEVLRELLADRRGSAGDLALVQCFPQGLFDLPDVESAVGEEVGIL